MSNNLSPEKRAQLVRCLCEGMSLRATSRICDVAFNTVLKFVPMIGQACSDYQDRVLRGLKCERLELDEQWNFVLKKQRNVREGERNVGDCWTWIALDASTKLVPSYFIGPRSLESAYLFMRDIKDRLTNRPIIVTDGFSAYKSAVENVFGSEADFAQVIKLFGSTQADPAGGGRYSPPACTGIKKHIISGAVPECEISTSFVERLNLSVRMHSRRCTRLTNAHSKKLENHTHAMSLFFMFYNFCRIHESLRCTPAMAAGVTQHVWDTQDLVALLDEPSEGRSADVA